MEDYDKFLEIVQQIKTTYGIIGLIAIVIVAAIFLTSLIYFKIYISKAAEEASEKALIKFQNKLDERLETKLKLFFRNEEIRNTLISHIAIKSIETKLNLWLETYQLYFDFQKTWDYDKQRLAIELPSIENKYLLNREKIFLNSVYLGGFLTEKLTSLNNSIRNAIKVKNRINSLTGISNGTLEGERTHYLTKIEELLPEIQNWLAKNLVSDHNSTMWDFTPEQLEFISKQNSEKFKELKEQPK